MLWAKRETGRVVAKPGERASCPACDGAVLAKCGLINIWHWAHEADADCDPWHEHETPWHYGWKQRFPPETQEVVVGPHRADVKLPSGLVIEFQSSSISPLEIYQRENFYGNMVWIVDAANFNLNLREKDYGHSFRWKHPRKSWWGARKPIYFDFGADQVFRVKRVYPDIPCGGYGNFVGVPELVEDLSRRRFFNVR